MVREEPRRFDISAIDFDLLRREFAKVKKKNLVLKDLSKNDIKKLKEVAASLLQNVKAKIAELEHWTDKQETKSVVDNLIRDTLWNELPECYDEVNISVYRQQIYEYVYTRYKEVA